MLLAWAVSPVPSSVSRGLRIAARGLRLALSSADVRRTYLRLAAVLVVLAAALSVGLGALVWWLVPVAEDMSWGSWLMTWGLRVGGTALALLAAPMLALFVVNLAFPFLADAVFMAGARAADPQLAARLEKPADVGLVASVVGSVRRLLYFLGVTLATVVVALVPVIGAVLGPALNLWFASRTLSWELLDPYFERVGHDYARQRSLVKARRATLAGFGLPWTMLMALPIVGPLLFGLAQAGVAALVVEDFEADTPR